MRGITNAPQGSGGSGGTWTLRAANNDWTDLFDVAANNYVTAKKDMILYSVDSHYKFMVFIPKGFAPNDDTIHIGTAYISDSTGNDIKLNCDVRISGGYMTTSYFNCVNYTATFTIDGSTVTVSKTMNSSSLFKSSIKVWTKE